MKGNLTLKEVLYATVLSFAAVMCMAMLLDKGPVNAGGYSFFWNVLSANISFMGDGIFAFAVVALMIFFFNRKDAGIRLLFAVLCCLFITQGIKNIFSEIPVQLFFESNRSFDEAATNPNIVSSHAAIAFTLTGFFALYQLSRLKRVTLFFAACTVIASRVFIAGESFWAIIPALCAAAVSLIFMMKISAAKSRVFVNKRRRQHTNVPEQLSWH